MQQLAYTIRDSLYLNITDACTLVCQFCPKTQGSHEVHDYDLTLERQPKTAEIIAAIGDPTRYCEVVFCGYGEPTARIKVLLEVADYIKAHGGRVRVNTDGLGNLINHRDILPEMAGRVDALSVSLNAQNEAVYNQHCQPRHEGSYQAMLAFLREAPRYVPDVTATAINDLEGVDIEACRQIAEEFGVHFRQRELDVVG